MTINMTATVLPDFAAVQLAITGAPAGPLEVLRTDDNGTHPVRQLADQETTSGTLALVDYEAALSGPVTYQVLGDRTNVLANASFDVNVTGWASGGGRLTLSRWSAVGNPQGGFVLRGVANVANSAGAGYIVTSALAPAVPGQPWSARAWVKPSITGDHQLSCQFYLGATQGASVGGPVVSCPAGAWTQLDVAVTIPTGVDLVRPLLSSIRPMAIGDYFEVDAAQLVQEPEAGPWIDGTVETIRQATVNLPLTTSPTLAVVGDPVLSQSVTAISSYGETSEGASRLVSIYAGGRLAVVGGLELRQGSVGLHVLTYPEAKALRAMLAPGVVAQLRQPTYPGLDLYLVPERVRIDPAPVDATPAQWTVTIDYTEREHPDVPLESSAAWTWDDLAALCPTWDDVPLTFPTWFDVAVGP